MPHAPRFPASREGGGGGGRKESNFQNKHNFATKDLLQCKVMLEIRVEIPLLKASHRIRKPT